MIKIKKSRNSAEIPSKQRNDSEVNVSARANEWMKHRMREKEKILYAHGARNPIDVNLTRSHKTNGKQILNRSNKMVNNQFWRTQNTHIQINLKSCCDSFVALTHSIASFSELSNNGFSFDGFRRNEKKMDAKTFENSYDSIGLQYLCMSVRVFFSPENKGLSSSPSLSSSSSSSSRNEFVLLFCIHDYCL